MVGSRHEEQNLARSVSDQPRPKREAEDTEEACVDVSTVLLAELSEFPNIHKNKKAAPERPNLFGMSGPGGVRTSTS